MEVVEGPVPDVGQLRDDVGQDGAAVVAAAARTVIVVGRKNIPGEKHRNRLSKLYYCHTQLLL